MEAGYESHQIRHRFDLAESFDGLGSIALIRLQQPIVHFERDTSLANKDKALSFEGQFTVGAGKRQANDLSRPQSRGKSGRVLLADHLAFPLAAAETSVASNGVEERAAAEHPAVV